MKQIKLSKNTITSVVAGLATFAALFIFVITYYSIPPKDFPQRDIITIKQGTYLSQATDILASENIIKSPLLFKIFVVLSSGHRQVLSGDYLFDSPQSALRVASRLVNGVQGLTKIKVTIYEGMTVDDIGNAMKKSIPDFDSKTFTVLAKPYEGYLFPDTYYFYENAKPADVVDLLNDTFNQKLKTSLLDIKAFSKPISEIITMASIVEKEATSSVDRRIIAGVLWRRIEIGMPLQVDPPFYYFLKKDSSQITTKDLSVDSPYNTYKRRGLPPTPIDNPGLSAIIDTITPTKSKYLFYLSDKKGNMRYASTYEAHLDNKARYM